MTEKRVSHVQISFDLAEGMRIQFTVEALPSKGKTDAEDEEKPERSQSPVEVVYRTGEDTEASSAWSPRVQVVVTPVDAAQVSTTAHGAGQSSARVLPLRRLGFLPVRLQMWVDIVRARPATWAAIVLGLSLAVYLAVRLIGLASFPIYFFTDEAVQTVLAADMVRDGFHSYDDVFLPTYFKNGNYYNLSTSVYLQVLPTLLFGKSVFVTRAVSVLVSILAALSVGLILKRIFRVSHWWSGVLLLSLAPAWFLHSRTAFETVIFVSFYAAALAGYLFYRCLSPRYLYPSLALAALAFYSYSPGQMIVAATGLLLLLSDLPYHWKNRSTILIGLGFLAILALPYVRFRLWNNDAPLDHLRNLGSYWMQPGTFSEKMAIFAREYLRGLSPTYWYLPNGVDLQRHLMNGYGHLLWWTLPFAFLGLLVALRNIASPAHRAILIALLAAPAGSALVGVGITRLLVFVIPATILTGLGLSLALDWIANPGAQLRSLRGSRILQRLEAAQKALDGQPAPLLPVWLTKWCIPPSYLAAGLFVFLSAANVLILQKALAHGPTWYDDYGMGGLQWGASQLFPALQKYIEDHPDTHLVVSPSWANGTDVVARFFLPDGFPIEMGSIAGHMFQKLPLDDNMLFVMIPQEYQEAQASGKFTGVRVERTLNTPGGTPGFYFVRLRYAVNIDEIMEAEREGRRQLEEGEVEIDGNPVRVRFSPLDMGDIQLPFDGDPHTVARTFEANPFVIELTFPEARSLSGLVVNIGSLQARITARLYAAPGADTTEFSTVYQGSVDHPEAVLDFGKAVSAKILRLEVESIHEGEPTHVHVWEVKFK